MYDTIKCDYPLPLGDDSKELTNVNLNEWSFQTKDLEKNLDHYVICSDGTLWIEKYDVEDKSNSNAIGWARYAGMYTRVNIHLEPMPHYTGTINFYNFYCSDNLENDYWVEYQATIIDGTVKQISLLQFDATNNTERKVRSKEHEENVELNRKLWNKWYMKYGYKYYDKFVAKIFKVWHNIPISAYQIERWLRPL